ncbi:glycosyltransferase [Pseudoalteromonas sp. JBTF-M23]|uniref:Glycosyltransferase n=1 Tax=Pseudoalteromonas caenipelagi TaxID=2726988 RepID=A0A849VEH0_9GAMM|nr:glycosyltransferase [Pseudoalteromonas caenipelagi]NOU51792.1 glycosyltransferase [Pseudoalteromonas caenipelagi]
MKEELPLVSIWMPTCNRLTLLKRAVASVLSQTYPNIELFIVDNGSTDGTSEYLEQLSAKYSQIRYHRFPTNLGACEARNYAIENSLGEFATGIDDDDEFLPTRIADLFEAYNDNYAFVCSGYIWDYGKIRRSLLNSDLIINLEQQLNFNQASNQIFTKRQKLIEAGMFDTTIVSSQDWEFWTRMIIRYGAAKRVGTATYIVHTAHDKPRITDSIDNRSIGLHQFYDRYGHLMSKSNHKCFNFLVHYSEGKKTTFKDVIRYFTPAIFGKLIRAWLATLFPLLAKKRLELFKRD